MFLITLSPALMRLLHFLSTRHEALICAATVLGGRMAARRLHQLIDALSAPEPRITRRIGEELIALHHLLAQSGNAAAVDPDAPYLVLIEPDDAALAEIALLAEDLRDCLQALVEENLVPADHPITR